MKVLVPNNTEIRVPSVNGVQFVRYESSQPITEEHRDSEALIIWGMPVRLQTQAARDLPNLRLVQSLAAGVNDVLAAGFDERVAICSGRGLHTIAVVEHALALLLAASRRLHQMRDAQHQRLWATALRSQRIRPMDEFTMLDGANIVIWGMGNIGTRLASVLTELGAIVRGVDLEAGRRGAIPVVSVDDIEKLLPHAHALVLILPDTPATRCALDDRRIRLLSNYSWVVNVGRGTTLDEDALYQALVEKRIAGAALDVFSVEPLPASSPLWGLENVIISPHAAGGRPVGAGDLVARQAQNLIDRRPLENQVDRGRGF